MNDLHHNVYGNFLHRVLKKVEFYRHFFLVRFLPSDVVERVRKGENPPFRPRVTADLVGHSSFLEMMRQAWDQNPLNRGKFSDCLKSLKQMNKGK